MASILNPSINMENTYNIQNDCSLADIPECAESQTINHHEVTRILNTKIEQMKRKLQQKNQAIKKDQIDLDILKSIINKIHISRKKLFKVDHM